MVSIYNEDTGKVSNIGGVCMNISSAFQLYQVDKQLDNYAESTLKSYKLESDLLIRRFGDVDLESLTLGDFKLYLLEQTQSGKKPSTISHRIKSIRSLYRWAADEGYIQSNPSVKLHEPKHGQRIPKALNDDELEILREACNTPLEHAIVEFFYATGCRIGEVFQINKDDINWDDKSLLVIGKGNKQRECYFTPKCAYWLRKYLADRKDDEPSLFVSERKPFHRPSIAQLRWVINRIGKRTQIKTKVFPHALRHTLATHLLNKGAALHVVQQILGHEKPETTLIYARLSGTVRRQAYQRYM